MLSIKIAIPDGQLCMKKQTKLQTKLVFHFLSLLVELNIFSEMGISHFYNHEFLFMIILLCK